ncbi:hypothetical protein B0J11DRAFT_242231 [Dendryphion nanum]|uniref:DUF7165 domain-containing protein n=1 Tax=Dendryphion nanum TaxID=256645 RepID=A0A9P9CXI0_9PLEO|nr:hypothetical protein B0J11DRAFT_242231 [Dendryphion nanum]
MGGRRIVDGHEHNLAIRTDVRAKCAVVGHDASIHPHGCDCEGESKGGVASRLPRTASLSSLANSVDEQVHTHLSASSAGNDTLSSSGMSGHSTARTSAITDYDRPSASSPLASSNYAHPAATVLELVSNTASSSALPDSFAFNLSRKGNFVAVYTSANIWLIKTCQLPRLWARTLRVRRKPVAIDIVEDGSLLAVLSKPSQVDLYEIHGEQDRQIRKRRTIMLVHEAHSMAISPDGLILITGNNFGIEVVSIGADAPESCRRTLSGPVGDTLEFSDDGRTLLITGYARKSGSSSMFILPGLYDGPFNEEGVPIPAAPEAAWTGLVLFPETTRIARQATLLPDVDNGQVNELFAFNAEEDTWGIYDIAAQRFTQRRMFLPDQQRWTRSEFLDDAMPAVSPSADLAAVALKMRGTTSLWIYQVPEWDYKPKSSLLDPSPIQPCFCLPILHDSDTANQEICSLRWVKLDSNTQRLVAVGNVSNVPLDSDGPAVPQGSKGVIIVLDFDKSKLAGGPIPNTARTEYDLDPLLPGERLPEGSIDFESEVELVRTRTLAQRRAQTTRQGSGRRHSRQAPGRTRTTTNRNPPPVPTITRDDEEELTMEEVQAAFEAPYDNTQPRSQSILARAATVAAVSPANRRHLRALPFRPLEYRRADGLREFPHESDADNWVPPPPAYTATAVESESVSLSHPISPPGPAPTRLAPTPGSSIPPVPPLPSNTSRLLSPTAPYQQAQSQSSIDLTLAGPQPRPSLLHPSTYPSPQSTGSGRRRSSTSQSHTSPPLSSTPSSQSQSAYQATSNILSAAATAVRRPSLRSRRTAASAASTVDLRPPPVIDPYSPTQRRGSVPETLVHRRTVVQRRPVPNASAVRPPNRMSMPLSGFTSSNGRSNTRRAMLPRLTTPADPASSSRRGPLSAPPRANTGGERLGWGQRRTEPSMDVLQQPEKEKGKEKSMKKLGCVVM